VVASVKEAMGEQVSLGKRINERRKTLKITQQELATALGVTPQHISAIEQDQNSPSLSLLPRLAEELGVTVDYLLTGKEEVITATIPAIKADKTLPLKVKRALIALVEEYHAFAIKREKI
jgi:transcriptional regulator with XRE-family HTH domain